MANVFDQMRPEQMAHSERVWGYAGFWWRVAAWAVDSAVLACAEILIQLAFGHSGATHDAAIPSSSIREVIPIAFSGGDASTSASWSVAASWLLTIASFLVQAAYFALLESSAWQATIGKRVCGLRVTGLNGGRISLARAFGRYFGKFLSALILGLGFLMAGWTRRKQALHDILAETLVVRLRPPSDLMRFTHPH